MSNSISQFFWRVFRHPRPYRAAVGNYLARKFHESESYPAYFDCVTNAAELAKGLGYPGITVIEFGVAGGNGLVALERHAANIEQRVGIAIDVVGFDSGVGLPPPTDYRDLPYHWRAGDYAMDEAKLRARLRRASLYMGFLTDTIPAFTKACRYPIGAAMMDLDFYSSTMEAFTLFDLAPRLPRAWLYFDDLWLATPYTGEWAAIRGYNESHPMSKLAQTWYSAHELSWRNQIFELHQFDHPEYSRNPNVHSAPGHLPLGNR